VTIILLQLGSIVVLLVLKSMDLATAVGLLACAAGLLSIGAWWFRNGVRAGRGRT
jgi:hypothetical protein